MYKTIKTMLLLGLILGVWQELGFSQEYHQNQPEAITQAIPRLQPDEVVVTGELICLGCSLKKEKQAKAQCSIYGHTNALLIQKVINANGQSFDEAKGKVYQFLHNDQSDKLIGSHELAGKTVIITGKIYPEANILEANFFKEK